MTYPIFPMRTTLLLAVNSNDIIISPSFPKIYDDNRWRPQICQVTDGYVIYENLSNSLLLVLKFFHFKPHLVNVNRILDVSHICPSSKSRRCNQPSSINTSPTIQPPVDERELLNLIKINKSLQAPM